MNKCEQCGASLSEGATFCPQCGAEVRPDAGPRSPSPTSAADLDFLKPAITGGLALGVLSSLPLLNAANCLCCLWVQGGGALSTWLLNRQRPGSLKYGDGAFAGVMAGLIGAIVATIISIPIQMVMFTEESAAQMRAMLDQMSGGMPPAAREMIEQMFTPGFDMGRVLLGLVFNLVLFGIFAMIGGILMVAIVNRQKTD